MRQGAPVDVRGDNGLQLYFAPVRARGEIVGAAGFAYGDPPRAGQEIARVAHYYGADIAVLETAAADHVSRPPFIVSLAKNRLIITVELMGEIIEHGETSELFLNPKEEQTEMYIEGRYG